jgi:hypothetical protein
MLVGGFAIVSIYAQQTVEGGIETTNLLLTFYNTPKLHSLSADPQFSKDIVHAYCSGYGYTFDVF